MACGLPALAVDAHGPSTIVDHGETGWLVPPDDEDALCEALVELVTDGDERRRRGEAAYEVARERYSWPALIERLAGVYDEVREGRRPDGGVSSLA
jgi:glycosyltransferase involved in cell wall biosynthesis